MQNTNYAFSLIELLIGLIIISVALACFAPVMSKRVRVQSTAIDTKLTEKCSGWGSNCKLCRGVINQGGYCVQCNLGCNVDQKLDVANCKCVQNNP